MRLNPSPLFALASLLFAAAAGAAPVVLYETGFEAAPASPAWVAGSAVAGQNGWLSSGASAARIRVIADGSADATVFGMPYTTPTGSQFVRFTASSSTTANNPQWAWPDITAAFQGRPSSHNRVVASMDFLVPSGGSLDDSLYALLGYDSIGDVAFGLYLSPGGQFVILSGPGDVDIANAGSVFPFDTWFNLAVQADYDTGDIAVLLNGMPVAGLAGNAPLLVGSVLADVDPFCVNDTASPNPRVVYADNYRVVVESNIAGPPANDPFSGAFLLTGTSGTTNGTTTGASTEPNEPEHAAISPAASVWYHWTPPTSGSYTFDTLQNTTVDTVLAVYTGNSLETLTEVAANDDATPGLVVQSRATFQANAGTTYRIVVDTKAPTRGNFRLRWRPTVQLSASRTPENHLNLTITAAAPGFYELQESTALPNWSTFDSISFTDAAGGTVNYDAGSFDTPARRFFRARQ